MVYVSQSGTIEDGRTGPLSSPFKWIQNFFAELFAFISLFLHSLLSPGITKKDMKNQNRSGSSLGRPPPGGGGGGPRGPRVHGFRRMGGASPPPMAGGG
ncbi:selenoprotein K-like [Symsagittifera roscoffensis]|uniref:selenoprotein K-like n=1 Tax=Symsagittifera roscoffensis TaxID=84072 RepID=UPI00307B5FC8